MSTKGNINPKNQPLFHAERYGFIILFISLIIGLEVTFTHAFSSRQDISNNILVENIEGLVHQTITNSHPNSHHSNYFTESSEESKVQEDDDDKLDDDWRNLHKNQSLTHESKERVEFIALTTSIKNTKKAKLFVLFHSWKHFLG